MPRLSACVAGAFGLAPGGSGLGILPLPLQSGHMDSIAIANSTYLWYCSLLEL